MRRVRSRRGPAAAGPAAEEGPRRNHDTRLPAPWPPVPVRGLGEGLGPGDRSEVPVSSPPEGLKCLRPVEKAGPQSPEIPLILDHYATPQPPKVLGGIERPKHLFRPFTPTRASGRNRVERCFSPRTEKPLRRGVFHSVPDLERSLQDDLKTGNENPGPGSGRRQPTRFSKRSGGAGRCWPPFLYNKY